MDKQAVISEYMRELTTRRRQVEVHCAVCGRPTSSTVKGADATPQKSYCSRTCRQKARRRRQRAERQASAPAATDA